MTISPRNIKLTCYSSTIAQLKLILHHNVQPLGIMPVPQSQVKSSEACSKTLQRRSHCLSSIREAVSGGNSTTQFQSEIRCLSREERQQLLHKADLPVVIPTDHALAMKADLCLSWNKLRIIRR